ncbi:hypothetical protein LZ30DRAFT_764526 [Colletotrichum cereale]|nr:hypothetical protein LZ30DRAFT_764526 [Colletotrichum cereale]
MSRELQSKLESHKSQAAIIVDADRILARNNMIVDTTFLYRLRQTVSSVTNRHLLPDCIRPIFRRTTRLQVLILAVLAGYLLVFSFVGIVYSTWFPVGAKGPYKTRTSLDPWSTRVGVLAYTIMPLSVLLGSRESIMSLLTGVPCQNGNFLHRWVEYIIVIQSTPHKIRWLIIELHLHQPQPASHYILAMLFISGCIGHWQALECFMGQRIGFSAASAVMTVFYDSDSREGDVIRLDFSHPHDAWETGKHFYLCFPESSIWQSRPFTALNAPITVNGKTRHSYIFRAKGGGTKQAAEIAARKSAASGEKGSTPTTSIILSGPYGDAILRNVTSDVNLLCVAGETGTTYVLPALLKYKHSNGPGKLELVWLVRHAKDVHWVKPELEALEAKGGAKVVVRIIATRDGGDAVSMSSKRSGSDSASHVVEGTGESQPVHEAPSSEASRHPEIAAIVREFVDATVSGRTAVLANGPGGLMSDIRAAAAKCNAVGKVWKGDERSNVSLIHDERMERWTYNRFPYIFVPKNQGWQELTATE